MRHVNALVVLAKAPRPGLAKTRLAAEGRRTLEQAAQLARAFLEDTLASVRAASVERRWLGFTPEDAAGEFAERAPDFERFAQARGDLGARIADAFERAFAAGAARAVVIGSDAPQLGAARIESALAELGRCELVLGPARDGGYYLIGLARPRPELFEGLAWSTERVLAQTLAHAQRAGLRVALLDELDDIDGDAELRRLEEQLAQTPHLAPVTARALAELRRAR